MNRRFLSLLCCCALFGLTSCNKPFIPNVVGTWGKAELAYFKLIYNEMLPYEQYHVIVEKISDVFKSNSEGIRDLIYNTLSYPRTISLNPDNTFSFFYGFGTPLTGTYEQNRYSLYFNPTTMEGMYGESDGDVVVLYLGRSFVDQPKEFFYYDLISLFRLSEEEVREYDMLILGYELHISYTRTSTSVLTPNVG